MEIKETVFTKRNEPYPPFETYFGNLSMGVLDIETTGLSPASSQVILAGLLFPAPSGDGWIMKQYFAEDPREEKVLLAALDEDYSPLDFVVTYNGRSFDLPFLEGRRKNLNLSPLPRRYNLDLYRLVRDFSDIGRFTPNLKQKTLERFLGLWKNRADEISGGESAGLYMDYLITGAADLKEKILLHNCDDVLQLYRLMGALSRVDLHKAMYRSGFPLTLEEHKYIIQSIGLGKDRLQVKGVQITAPVKYVYYGDEFPHFRFSEDGFSFTVPTLSHKDLVLVDGRQLGVATVNAMEGYSVIKKSEEVNYSEINLLVGLLLERIIKQWITKK